MMTKNISNRLHNLWHSHGYMWDLSIGLVWFAWASVWWNVGFHPSLDGREATLSYMWLQGIEPFRDQFAAPITLSGHFLNAALIKVFGFVPVVWRLAFVLYYWCMSWVSFRLILRVCPPVVAFTSVVAGTMFFPPMFTYPFWFYWWNGVCYALLSTYFLAKAFEATGTAAMCLHTFLSAGFLVITLFTIPQFALACIITFGIVFVLRLFSRADRTDNRAVIFLWISSIVILLGLAALGLHMLGWLTDYFDWLATFKRHSAMYGFKSIWEHLEGISYLFRARPDGPLPRVLAGVGGFWLGIILLHFLNKGMFSNRIKVLGWINITFSVALVGWTLADHRRALQIVLENIAWIYTVPALVISVCVVLGVYAIRNILVGEKSERDNWFHWLLIICAGNSVWLAGSLSHPDFERISMPLCLFALPVAWAGAWTVLPKLFNFKWPQWTALPIVALVIVGGISAKVFRTPMQPSWLDAQAKYYSYPNLKGLRGFDADFLDDLLFKAKKIVDNGGTILAFPSKIPLYPLVGALPPIPFPDLLPTSKVFSYPREAEIRERAMKEMDDRPPELLILDSSVLKNDNWLKESADTMPDLVRAIIKAHQAGHSPPNYQLIANGHGYTVFERVESRGAN